MVPRGLPKEQMGILPFNRRRLYYFKRTFLSGKLEESDEQVETESNLWFGR